MKLGDLIQPQTHKYRNTFRKENDGLGLSLGLTIAQFKLKLRHV